MNPSRVSALVKGLASILALSAVVVGLPIALVLAIGWPLPHGLPTPSTISHALTVGNVSPRLWLGLMACVMWLAWASFSASVAVEVLATLRGTATPRLHGLGPAQRATAQLVGVIVLTASALLARPTPRPALAGLGGAAPTALIASTGMTSLATPTARASTSRSARSEPLRWTVGEHETLWGIAEKTLGTGTRAPEIVALTADHIQPSGQRLASVVDHIQPGWVLFLPPDAQLPVRPDIAPAAAMPSASVNSSSTDSRALDHPVTARFDSTDSARSEAADATRSSDSATVDRSEKSEATAWTVAPGDNFWTIARRVLAERLGREPSNAEIVSYWQSLINANEAKLVEPGNANLIEPGQVFFLPGTALQPDAHGPGAKPKPSQQSEAPATKPSTTPPAPSVPSTTAPAAPAASDAPAPAQQPKVGSSTATNTSASSTTGTTAGTPTSSADTTATEPPTSSPVPLPGSAGPPGEASAGSSSSPVTSSPQESVTSPPDPSTPPPTATSSSTTMTPAPPAIPTPGAAAVPAHSAPATTASTAPAPAGGGAPASTSGPPRPSSTPSPAHRDGQSSRDSATGSERDTASNGPGSSAPPPPAAQGLSPDGSPSTFTSSTHPSINPDEHEQRHRHGHHDGWELLLGGLATAGAVDLLRRLRRRQQQVRHRGADIAMPQGDERTAEVLLRAGADTQGATRLAKALRALDTVTGVPALAPELVIVDTDSIDLVFQTEPDVDPPRPWRVSGDHTWSLPDHFVDGAASSGASPLSLLLPLGRQRASEVLLDVAAIGVLTLEGAQDAVDGLLTSLIWAAVTSEWLDDCTVLVHAAGAAAPGSPWVRTVESLDEAIDALELRATQAVHDLAAVGAHSTYEARVRGLPEAWEPMLVITSQEPSEHHRERIKKINELASGCVALIAPGTPIGPWHGSLSDDGQLHLQPPNLVLEPHALAPETNDRLQAVVDTALDTSSAPGIGQPQSDLRPSVDTGTSFLPESEPEDCDEADYTVRVLGEVDIVDRTGTRVAVNRSRAEELIVYLALVDEPVSISRLETDLWPDSTSAKSRTNAVSEARRALGTAPDGAPYLAPLSAQLYELRHVTSDWAEFERLRRQGEADSGPAGDSALHQALALVRGAPFSPGRGGFNWVAPFEQRMLARIADTAELLAERRLAAGDLQAATNAARLGLSISPADERLFRVLLRAAHQAGNFAQLESVVRELHRIVEEWIEPYGSLQPETIELLDQLRPSRRSA